MNLLLCVVWTINLGRARPGIICQFYGWHGFITVINPIGAVTSLAYEAKMAEIFGTDKNDLAVSERAFGL